jgi:hypothetical protein
MHIKIDWYLLESGKLQKQTDPFAWPATAQEQSGEM